MKTYVCGHRNPDVDSVMSAYALADLRRRTGLPDVEALCAGRLPPKAKWVCDRFGLKAIRTRRDVYVRVRDLINPLVPAVDSSMTLEEALRLLAGSGNPPFPCATPPPAPFWACSRPPNFSISSSPKPICR
jgi:manganese-dependent inorganic pyrophosphatase